MDKQNTEKKIRKNGSSEKRAWKKIIKHVRAEHILEPKINSEQMLGKAGL